MRRSYIKQKPRFTFVAEVWQTSAPVDEQDVPVGTMRLAASRHPSRYAAKVALDFMLATEVAKDPYRYLRADVRKEEV